MRGSKQGVVPESFRVNPGDQFDFVCSQHGEIYHALFSSVFDETGVLLLSGESGVGKTALLQHLKEDLLSQGCMVYFFAGPPLTFEKLVTDSFLQLTSNDKAFSSVLPIGPDVEQLLLKKSKITAFILDEAGAVSDEVIEQLIGIVEAGAKNGKHLIILFSSKESMESRFESLDKNDLIVMHGRLEALDSSGAESYIRKQLINAGYKRENLFSSDAIKRITTLSNGLPASINALCRSCLILANPAEDEKVTAETVEEAIKDLYFEELLEKGTEFALQEETYTQNRALTGEDPGTGMKKESEIEAMGGSFPLVTDRFRRIGKFAVPLILVLGVFSLVNLFVDQDGVDVPTRSLAEVTPVTEPKILSTADSSGVGVAQQNIPARNTTNVIAGKSPKPEAIELLAQARQENEKNVEVEVSDVNVVTQPEKKIDSLASTEEALAIIKSLDISPSAGPPLVLMREISGPEDASVPLKISVRADIAERDDWYIEMTGVPGNAALSAGNKLSASRWHLNADQLAGLELVPARNSDKDIAVNVQLKEKDLPGVIAEEQLKILIDAVADEPVIKASAAAGDQYTAIPIEVRASLLDTDGSEDLSILVYGIPDTVNISAGTSDGLGAWILLPEQLPGLYLIPGEGAPAELDLTFVAMAKEKSNDDTLSASGSLIIPVILSSITEEASP